VSTTAPARPTTRADHVTEVVPLTALDGRPLTVVHVQGRHPPTRGPVLLVHGAGVRAELFRPPLPRTLVDALLDEGWDVWMLNWRASIDLDPVPWTLDQAAAHDHPAAVRHVLRVTGADRLKAVVHCQGSTSFTIAAVAGLLPEVDTVVTNAVSLHPVVPRLSTLKIGRLSPVIGRVLPYVSRAGGTGRPDRCPARWSASSGPPTGSATTRCAGW
jgi:predicted alpha/beta hydrolase